MISMKFVNKLLLLFTVLFPVTAMAQLIPAAHEGPFSIYAGGFGSWFQPQYPPQNLYGVGAYTDIKLRKWVQFEAEGRWLHLNEPYGAYQNNYSVGPRVPIHRFGKMETYGKVLITDTKINFASGYGYGHYLDYTFGGSADVRLTRHLMLRAVDYEYHYVTNYFGSAISPYGISVGMAYRVY